MTKFYCDKCGKECTIATLARLSISEEEHGTLSDREFCQSCKMGLLTFFKSTVPGKPIQND